MPEKSIYFSRFMPSLKRGGGSRRMMQMFDLFKEMECELVSSAQSDHLDHEARQRIKVLVEKKNESYPQIAVEKKRWNDYMIHTVHRLREISKEWIKAIPDLLSYDLAILDDPIYFIPLVKKLKRLKIPILAICHNLEGLSLDRMEKGHSLNLFYQEKEILAQCDITVTISSEENVILSNFGIPCLHIPYYPVPAILERMLAVREMRKWSDKKNILLVGNTVNSPTREGINKAISHWRSNHLGKTGEKLLIAGYDMEKYFPSFEDGEGVECLGELSDEALDDHLAHVKACLCYQENGSGALTRICEMLIAGLPVLSNSHAARSYFEMKGVIEFRKLEDLETAINQMEIFDGQIPVPPEVDSSSFIKIIKRRIGLR